MNHTSECLTIQNKYREWAEQWPNHCTRCGAWGFLTSSENIGEREAPVIIENKDVCPSCLEMNKCPRCRSDVETNEDGELENPCRNCGWTEDDGCLIWWYECPCWQIYDLQNGDEDWDESRMRDDEEEMRQIREERKNNGLFI